MNHYGYLNYILSSIRLANFLGLEIARLADLPSDVLVEARRVSHRLAELEEAQHAESEASRVAARSTRPSERLPKPKS